MGDLSSVLAALHEAGVTLEVSGDNLRCQTTTGALTPVVKQWLKQHKRKIMAWFGDSRPDIRVVVPNVAKLTAMYARLDQARSWGGAIELLKRHSPSLWGRILAANTAVDISAGGSEDGNDSHSLDAALDDLETLWRDAAAVLDQLEREQ